MRTLFVAIAIGTASVNLCAQGDPDILQYQTINLGNGNIEALPITPEAVREVDTCFYRLKRIWCNELFETYSPKLVARFGLDETKSLVFDATCPETVGDTTATHNGENAPLLHTQRIMYDDYVQHNFKNASDVGFTFEDLFKPGNAYLSLVIFDWHANTQAYGGYDTHEEIVRTWNGGYLGASDNLTVDYFKKTGEKGFQEHQIRLQNTRKHYAKFLRCRAIREQLEASGRGVML